MNGSMYENSYNPYNGTSNHYPLQAGSNHDELLVIKKYREKNFNTKKGGKSSSLKTFHHYSFSFYFFLGGGGQVRGGGTPFDPPSGARAINGGPQTTDPGIH